MLLSAFQQLQNHTIESITHLAGGWQNNPAVLSHTQQMVSAVQQSRNKYILMTLHKLAEPDSCGRELCGAVDQTEADFILDRH